MRRLPMEPRIVKTDCTLCYHSCGVEVTVDNGKAVKVAGLKGHPLTGGELCPKGEAMIENIYSPERLRHPMKKVEGRWERIGWEQALNEISARLRDLKDRCGPEVLGVFSGSIGVENMETAGQAQAYPAGLGRAPLFS